MNRTKALYLDLPELLSPRLFDEVGGVRLQCLECMCCSRSGEVGHDFGTLHDDVRRLKVTEFAVLGYHAQVLTNVACELKV